MKAGECLQTLTGLIVIALHSPHFHPSSKDAAVRTCELIWANIQVLRMNAFSRQTAVSASIINVENNDWPLGKLIITEQKKTNLLVLLVKSLILSFKSEMLSIFSTASLHLRHQTFWFVLMFGFPEITVVLELSDEKPKGLFSAFVLSSDALIVCISP